MKKTQYSSLKAEVFRLDENLWKQCSKLITASLRVGIMEKDTNGIGFGSLS